MHFADRLTAAIRAKGTPAVVGLDPRLEWLPEEFHKPERKRPGDSARAAAGALMDFNREILDLVALLVPAVKVQIAFYERFGPAGLDTYAKTLTWARSKGLLVIGDIKRGDIGSTSEAYAEAHLGTGAPFEVDAVTLNPWMGRDAAEPFLRKCRGGEKGVFILVRTSNPSADELQDLRTEDGQPIWQKAAGLVRDWGDADQGRCGYSSVGAVVGATHPAESSSLRRLLPHSYFLVPGYGAQGGTAADVVPCFNADRTGAIVNSSRGILFAYRQAPWKDRFGAADWRQAVVAATEQMRGDLALALTP